MTSSLALKIGLGSVTAGTVAVGGGYWIFGSKEETHSFKREFSHALIGNDDAIWGKKLDLLKASGSVPKYKKLQKAKSTDQEGEAKRILKESCEEISNSEYTKPVGDDYLDFKNFCSISNKDKVSSWLDEGSRNARLKELKEGTESLTSEFKKLKDSITDANSPSTDNQSGLTRICDSLGSEIFKGDASVAYLNVSSFCKKT